MLQFTKKAIVDSFMKLLEERPFNRITVKDIAKECSINRKTFYYYYSDIYALTEDIFKIRMQEVKEGTPPDLPLAESILLPLHYLRENRKAILHLMDGINNAQFMKLLHDSCAMPVREFIRAQAEKPECSEEDVSLLVEFYTSAVLGMLFSWFNNGLNEDPEAVVRQLVPLLKGTVSCALHNSADNKKQKKPRKSPIMFWTKG